MNLMPFFETAVVALNKKKSAELGDRTLYIGSSNVASCARQISLQRKYPKTPSVSNLLKMSRGHAAEILIDNIFQAGGLSYDTQVEVKHHEYPLRAHIDFLVRTEANGIPELHIIEVKSMSGIPDAPYPNHEDQLMYQLGLLHITYPDAKIGGSILAVDLNAGQVHQFNGYRYDDNVFNYLFNRALYLLDVLSGVEADPHPSPSNLCGYCQYRSDCPAMILPKVKLPLEIEALAGKYAEQNSIKSHAEKELKSLRQELLDFTGPKFSGRSDNYDLIVTSIASGLAVDGNLLKSNYPDIYPMVLKERAGYSKLEVKQLKHTTV
jgi:CRISPR/Cas system-associated exonuclease Cas4 (RecB family)